MRSRRQFLARSTAALLGVAGAGRPRHLIAQRRRHHTGGTGGTTTAPRILFQERWANPSTNPLALGINWTTDSPFGQGLEGNATWGEQQVYAGQGGAYGNGNPFSIGAAGLTITAAPIAPALQPLVPAGAYPGGVNPNSGYRYGWTSGALSTAGLFGFQYGYLEIVARCYRQAGCWMNGQLFGEPMSGFPEVDVLQYSGLLDQSYPALLVQNSGEIAGTFEGTALGGAWHSYGLLRTSSALTWYLDRRQVLTKAKAISQKMFITLNLAVGGTWSQKLWPDQFVGLPTPGTTYRADIQSVTVWDGRPF